MLLVLCVIGIGLLGWRKSLAQLPPQRLLERVPPQVHSLPETLQRWQPAMPGNDYFEQIQPVDVGYLIWSRFPVRVYTEPLSLSEQQAEATLPQRQRSQDWIDAVHQAVREWNAYLPLTLVAEPTIADITILRASPPLRWERSSARSLQLTLRARAAEARFEVFAVPEGDAQSALRHRFKIHIRPGQSPLSTLATARHELGHALGIWGHSLNETDALYAAQVRHPPLISERDVNTLKRIYQQPTQLGWTTSSSSTDADNEPVLEP
jgi:predicted Zn-dependent protease